MAILRLFFYLLLIVTVGWGSISEGVSQKLPTDSLEHDKQRIGTAITNTENTVDSLTRAPELMLEGLEQKTDSLMQSTKIVQQADSLHQKSRHKQRQIEQKIDSLQRALDAGNHFQQSEQQMQQTLQQTKQIQESKKALSNIKQNTGLNVTPEPPGIPAVDSPNLLPNLPSESMPELPKLPSADMPDMDLPSKDLPSKDLPRTNIPDMDITNAELPHGKGGGLPKPPTELPKVKEFDKAAEKQFSKQAAGQELQQQQQAMEEFKKQPERYQKQGERYLDKNHWRQQAQQQALKALQKQAAPLKEAKTSLAKLKRKYKTVQTDQKVYLKKASLKGEPFKRRVTTGLSLQIHQGPPTAFDLSPFVGYQWSKRWITGLGGTYRLAFSSDHYPKFSQPVYGGRIYGEWIALKSFLLHVEGESLRAYVPSYVSKDNMSQWVNTILVGGGKQYTITKKLKGNVVYLYTYPYLPYGPYQVRHQVRFGLIIL